MTTASPRDVTRLLQTGGRGERAVLAERIPLADRELCARVHHRIGRQGLGYARGTTAATRAP